MVGRAGPVVAEDLTLPLAPALEPLFPEGRLRRGTTVEIGRGAALGATSLALALLRGPCAEGSWCAVVGIPGLGLVAAAQLGADLGHVAVVPFPGTKWPVVTAALLEGLDIVVLRPPGGAVGQPAARKLEARARERGAVLVVIGGGWPGAVDIRLAVVAARWRGIEDGHGHLWGREVEVAASGRGAASRERRARFWLGGPGPGVPAVTPSRPLSLAGSDLGLLGDAAGSQAPVAGLTGPSRTEVGGAASCAG